MFWRRSHRWLLGRRDCRRLDVVPSHACSIRKWVVSIVGSSNRLQMLERNRRSIDVVPEIDSDRLHLTKAAVAGRIPL